MIKPMIAEEVSRLSAHAAAEADRKRIARAGELFESMVAAEVFPEFLTIPAYKELIESEGFAMISEEVSEVEWEWEQDRWKGVKRPYTAKDVVRLRGSMRIEHTLAARWVREALEEPPLQSLRPRPRHAYWEPGCAGGPVRPQSDLRQRMAGGGGCEPCWPDISRSEPLPL